MVGAPEMSHNVRTRGSEESETNPKMMMGVLDGLVGGEGPGGESRQEQTTAQRKQGKRNSS